MASENVNQSAQEFFCGSSISGGRTTILSATGIDIRNFPQVMDGSGEAVVRKDGHTWTITPWEGGGGFAVASRPQTESEIESERQRMLRSTFVAHFTKDRLLMCMDIAEQVTSFLAQMRPDHPPSRAVRRDMHRKLNRLVEIQKDLLLRRTADSSLYEQELKELRAA